MKTQWTAIALTLITLGSSTAKADNLEIIPGGPMKIQDENLRYFETFKDYTAQMKRLVKGGLDIIAVGYNQNVESGATVLVAGKCTLEPAYVCTPKKALVVAAGFQFRRGPYKSVKIVKMSEMPTFDGYPTDATVSLLNALAHVTPEFERALAGSNTITGGEVQFVSPKFSNYGLNLTYCARFNGGDAKTCLGGAVLRIQESRETYFGRSSFKAKLTFLR